MMFREVYSWLQVLTLASAYVSQYVHGTEQAGKYLLLLRIKSAQAGVICG